MHMRFFAFSSLSALAVAVVGCGGSGGDSIPPAATASVSVTTTASNPYIFNLGSGVLIGEKGFASFNVQNVGSASMTVQSAVYTGDGAITLSPGVSPATPATIAYSAYFVVSLTCTPTTATTYNGSVEIKSDASNLPDIVVYLQCQGIAPTP